MVGDWSGRVVPFHFAYLEMRITQQGSSVTGVACYMDPEGSTDGKGILFSNAPVVIDNPNVSVTTQSGDFTFHFNGQFQSNGTIAGQYQSGSSNVIAMTLSRGGSYCGL
jgi:hypothetical protein